MRKAKEIVQLIESLITKSINEGDTDGEVVVEGKDWDSTCSKFKKAIEHSGIDDHDDIAFRDIGDLCLSADPLGSFVEDSCILSIRTAKRGKTKYYDYLIRINFDLSKKSLSSLEKYIKSQQENDIESLINKNIRRYVATEDIKDFGFNVKFKKKENILSCKFVFKLEKV